MRALRTALSTLRYLVLALGLPRAALAATITVTTTADSGPGSLRQAIVDSNTSVGTLDTIAFDIPGAGPHTIAVVTPLTAITDPVVIDGTTQPGYAGAPLVEINGVGAGGSQHGLTINAGGSTVRGLAINRCNGSAIQLFTGDGNTIEDNYLGTNVAGTAALLNGYGVNTFGSDGNIIQNNLISGNGTGIMFFATGNTVRGNFVGTDVTGTAAIPNTTGIQDGTGGNTIGGALTLPASGPCALPCNLISGNSGVGVNVSQAGTSTTVQGNFIGTDVTGLAALGNGSYGITVFSGNGHVVSTNLLASNFAGIGMNAAPGVIIQGNFIGTDRTGTVALPNDFGIGAFNGADGTQIGGAAGGPGASCVFPCNLISGNAGHGIMLGTGGSSIGQDSDVIQGNCIGTEVDCVSPLPNASDGIQIGFSASDETIGGTAPGEGNVIAFNAVGINMGSGERNAIRGNAIFSNDGLGIDLGSTGVTPNDPGDGDGGANQQQNFPIITSVEPALASGPLGGASTRIQGFIRGAASTQLEIDFFSNSACADRPQEFLEGRTYLGSTNVTTDGSGTALFDVTLPVDVAANDPVSATATDPLGNTSEFSQRLPLSVFPTSGTPAGGTNLTITGTDFQAGATVTIGGVAAGNVVFNNSNSISAVSPILPAGTVNDLTVTNPDGSEGTLPKGWVADFLDVLPANSFYPFVTTLVRNAITVGIGGGLYGVNDNTLRQQMAVFLLKARFGLCYTPPPCTGVFTDVPCPSIFAPWIEALADLGVTGGCGTGIYCPQNPVRRDQMAVFLLKTKYGSSYVPPVCTGDFPDVPCPSPFADWIEQLAAEDITGGCGGGNYCPLNPNTRGQMAVFLVKTFNLQ